MPYFAATKKTAKTQTMKNFTSYERPSQTRILNPLKSLYNENGSFFSYNPISMKTLLSDPTKFEIQPAIKVKPLIDKLIKAVLFTSVEQRIPIINDVSADFQLVINEDKFAFVVGNLICSIINFSYDDHLQICVLKNDVIVLRLENTNLSRNKSFVVSLESILVIAERLGISLKIEEFYGKGSDVSICFLRDAA
jgi:hypothetical protein